MKKIQISQGPVARKAYHWHISPETPAGTKVLYLRFSSGKVPKNGIADAETWMCHTDGTGHQKLIDHCDATTHTGINANWIDNERFVYRGRNPDRIVVRNIDGVDERAIECGNVGPIDYNQNNQCLLTGLRGNGSKLADVWHVNPYTGERRKILDASAFLPWKERMPLSSNPEDWQIWHRYWNPSGTLIWICLEAYDPEHKKRNELIFSFNAEGKDIVCCEKKGIHPFWWNDHALLQNGYLTERDGAPVRQVCGYVNHTGGSPDREWIVGESCYFKNPTRLFLYRDFALEGEKEAIVLDETKHSELIWKNQFHADPSFSRDGKRIYANWPISESEIGVFSYDISSLVSENRQIES